MRSNLDDNLARRVRHSSALFSTVEATLIGTYVVSPGGPQFHYLNPNGVSRSVFLPPIEKGGGQFYIISNTGTVGLLVVRDSTGVTQFTLNPGVTARFISSKLRWFVSVEASATGIGSINGEPGPAITIVGGPGIGVTTLSNVVSLAGLPFSPTLPGDVPASGGGTATFLRADGTWAAPPGGAGGREVLLANRSYFVKTPANGGSDTNNGLTPATSFATIKKALAVAVALDLSIFSVQINVGDGTYTEPAIPVGITLKTYVGAGPIVIVGNIANPQNVILDVTGGDCISAPVVMGRYIIAGFTLRSPTFGFAGIRASGGPTNITLQDIRWDAATFQVFSDYGSQLFLTGKQDIVGDFFLHYNFTNKGIIQDVGKTINLIGARTFTFFAFGNNNGMLLASGSTYVAAGGATGQRFNNSTLGLIVTGDPLNLNFFPGSIPGVTWSGGYF